MMTQFWKEDYQRPPSEAIDGQIITDDDKPLPWNFIKGLLHILKVDADEELAIVGTTFSLRLQERDPDWSGTLRTYFKPEDGYEWRPIHPQAPEIDDDVLVIPISYEGTDGRQRWAMAVRFRVLGKCRRNAVAVPWAFAIIDPTPGNNTMARFRNLIVHKTTLANAIGRMDEDEPLGDDATQSRFVELNCPATNRSDDGHRLILHCMLLMDADLNEFQERLEALAKVRTLEKRTRLWVREILTDERNIDMLPDWLDKICNNRDGLNEETPAHSIAKRPLLSYSGDDSDEQSAEMQRPKKRQLGDALMSPDHLDECMKAINKLGKGAIALPTDFIGLARSEGRTWSQNRDKYFAPRECTDPDNMKPEIKSSKLLIPIPADSKEESPLMGHFFAVVRFNSKAESDHDWDFLVIDSQNEEGRLDFAKKIITERTTLANPISSIDNNIAGQADSCARWKSVPTVEQTGTECGPRTALHLYIAAHSKDALDFESKIKELEVVESDERLCPKVRSWAEELRAGTFDANSQSYEWLQAIVVEIDE